MKKILALAVAGTLMMTSSVCVFATEGIGITEGNTDTNTSGGSTAIPSRPAVDLQEQLNTANQNIGRLESEKERQAEEIANLKAELQSQNARNESTIKTLQQQFEAFRQAQEKNYETLSNEKNSLSKQLANTQKSLSDAVTARDKYQEKYKNATKHGKNEAPSRAAQLSRNNAIGDGYGGYIAQGGHVQINGGKSNVTFTLAAPTAGVLSSANQYANSVGGTLLHCVTTSSPGVSFKTATVNFTVTGVYANDTIAVYQLQGKNWVQVLVSSVTDNHVTVNLTQHGPLAFVRVAAVATATH